MTKPRNHHYVSKWWQKRFSPDGTIMIYNYDEATGSIERASAKTTMVTYDLYTLDQSGTADVTAETEYLQKVDDNGAKAFDAIVSRNLSASVREEVAEFLAIQVLRVPKNRTLYYKRAWQMFEELVEIFNYPSARDLNRALKDKGLNTAGAEITDAEMASIKATAGSRDALENYFASLDPRLGRDHLDLPWTDLLQDSTAQGGVRDVLLAQEWWLVNAPNDAFVLGDTGIAFDQSDLASGARVPLSMTAALWIEPCEGAPRSDIQEREYRPHEAAALNYEVAAWAEHWIAGPNENLLEDVARQRNSRLVGSDQTMSHRVLG